MKLLPNMTIVMNPKAKLFNFAVCQSYWDMPETMSLDNHLFELVRQYATSKEEIKRIVADNPVVVTDICCHHCQRYFMPKTVDDLITVSEQGFYRCETCWMAYRAGRISS